MASSVEPRVGSPDILEFDSSDSDLSDNKKDDSDFSVGGSDSNESSSDEEYGLRSSRRGRGRWQSGIRVRGGKSAHFGAKLEPEEASTDTSPSVTHRGRGRPREYVSGRGRACPNFEPAITDEEELRCGLGAYKYFADLDPEMCRKDELLISKILVESSESCLTLPEITERYQERYITVLSRNMLLKYVNYLLHAGDYFREVPPSDSCKLTRWKFEPASSTPSSASLGTIEPSTMIVYEKPKTSAASRPAIQTVVIQNEPITGVYVSQPNGQVVFEKDCSSYPHECIITVAILKSSQRRLKLYEILMFYATHYQQFRKNEDAWVKAIIATLHSSNRFEQVSDHTNSCSFWKLNPEFASKLKVRLQKRRTGNRVILPRVPGSNPVIAHNLVPTPNSSETASPVGLTKKPNTLLGYISIPFNQVLYSGSNQVPQGTAVQLNPTTGANLQNAVLLEQVQTPVEASVNNQVPQGTIIQLKSPSGANLQNAILLEQTKTPVEASVNKQVSHGTFVKVKSADGTNVQNAILLQQTKAPVEASANKQVSQGTVIKLKSPSGAKLQNTILLQQTKTPVEVRNTQQVTYATVVKLKSENGAGLQDAILLEHVQRPPAGRAKKLVPQGTVVKLNSATGTNLQNAVLLEHLLAPLEARAKKLVPQGTVVNLNSATGANLQNAVLLEHLQTPVEARAKLVPQGTVVRLNSATAANLQNFVLLEHLQTPVEARASVQESQGPVVELMSVRGSAWDELSKSGDTDDDDPEFMPPQSVREEKPHNITSEPAVTTRKRFLLRSHSKTTPQPQASDPPGTTLSLKCGNESQTALAAIKFSDSKLAKRCYVRLEHLTCLPQSVTRTYQHATGPAQTTPSVECQQEQPSREKPITSPPIRSSRRLIKAEPATWECLLGVETPNQQQQLATGCEDVPETSPAVRSSRRLIKTEPTTWEALLGVETTNQQQKLTTECEVVPEDTEAVGGKRPRIKQEPPDREPLQPEATSEWRLTASPESKPQLPEGVECSAWNIPEVIEAVGGKRRPIKQEPPDWEPLQPETTSEWRLTTSPESKPQLLEGVQCPAQNIPEEPGIITFETDIVKEEEQIWQNVADTPMDQHSTGPSESLLSLDCDKQSPHNIRDCPEAVGVLECHVKQEPPTWEASLVGTPNQQQTDGPPGNPVPLECHGQPARESPQGANSVIGKRRRGRPPRIRQEPMMTAAPIQQHTNSSPESSPLLACNEQSPPDITEGAGTKRRRGRPCRVRQEPLPCQVLANSPPQEKTSVSRESPQPNKVNGQPSQDSPQVPGGLSGKRPRGRPRLSKQGHSSRQVLPDPPTQQGGQEGSGFAGIHTSPKLSEQSAQNISKKCHCSNNMPRRGRPPRTTREHAARQDVADSPTQQCSSGPPGSQRLLLCDKQSSQRTPNDPNSLNGKRRCGRPRRVTHNPANCEDLSDTPDKEVTSPSQSHSSLECGEKSLQDMSNDVGKPFRIKFQKQGNSGWRTVLEMVPELQTTDLPQAPVTLECAAESAVNVQEGKVVIKEEPVEYIDFQEYYLDINEFGGQRQIKEERRREDVGEEGCGMEEGEEYLGGEVRRKKLRIKEESEIEADKTEMICNFSIETAADPLVETEVGANQWENVWIKEETDLEVEEESADLDVNYEEDLIMTESLPGSYESNQMYDEFEER